MGDPGGSPAARAAREILVLDCAYSLEQIAERGLKHTVTQHDLGGFFDHAWYVQPLLGASAAGRGEPAVGPARTARLSPRHTAVEAPVGLLAVLRRLPAANLALAQCALLVRLSGLLRRRPIRLIVVADPFYLGLLGLGLARLHRVALAVRVNANYETIYTSFGLPIYPRLLRSRRLEERIARFVFARADLVTVGSDDNRRYVLAAGAREDRVALVPTGDMIAPVHLQAPDDRPSVAHELGLADRRLLVFVGRLETLKHPDAALLVLASLKRTHPDAALLFVGDGFMRDELERRARELGVADDVRFAGTRDQAWVARALRSATVALCPYSGLVLVEAALSATAIVGYDVEWHGEFVASGETGILVPYGDVERLADAVRELFDDPQRARALGCAARERALREMDRDEAAAVKRAAYAAVCATTRAWRPRPPLRPSTTRARRRPRRAGRGPGSEPRRARS